MDYYNNLLEDVQRSIARADRSHVVKQGAMSELAAMGSASNLKIKVDDSKPFRSYTDDDDIEGEMNKSTRSRRQ